MCKETWRVQKITESSSGDSQEAYWGGLYHAIQAQIQLKNFSSRRYTWFVPRGVLDVHCKAQHHTSMKILSRKNPRSFADAGIKIQEQCVFWNLLRLSCGFSNVAWVSPPAKSRWTADTEATTLKPGTLVAWTSSSISYTAGSLGMCLDNSDSYRHSLLRTDKALQNKAKPEVSNMKVLFIFWYPPSPWRAQD